MKKFTKLLKVLGFLFGIIVLVGGCQPKPVEVPLLETSLYIVSPVGEVIEDTRYINEPVLFRIYFEHTSLAPETVRVSYAIDNNLGNIQPLQGGVFDSSTNTAEWNLENIPPNELGFVEVSGVITGGGVITNQAFVSVEGVLEITTNSITVNVVNKPRTDWIPFVQGAKEGDLPGAYMKDETTVRLTVNFDIPGMFVNEVIVDSIVFHRLSIPGHATLMSVGEPELPIVGQIVEVPYGVNFELEIIKSESITLEYYNVFPAQEPQIRQDGTEGDIFSINPTVYQANNDYPGALAAIQAEDIGVIRGHRIVFLKVNPLQFNPFTRSLEAYSQIEVRLKYDQPAQIQGIDYRLLSPAFEDILGRSILNYKHPSRFDIRDTSKEREGGDYLIITHGDFYDPADANNPIVRFQNWKQQKGYRTIVIDIDDIPNGDTADDIHDYIESAYDNWDFVPTYVLLVGDSEFIPTNYQTVHPSAHNGTDIGTDLYYATVDGTDYFPDLFIGRLSVDTLAQAEDVIEKILDYEINPPAAAGFYTDTSLVGLFEDDTDPRTPPAVDPCPEDGTEDCTFRVIEFTEEIRVYLDVNGYNPERIYATSSGYPGDLLSDQPTNYEDGTALPDDLTVAGNPAAGIPGFGWNGGTADISAAINNGNFLVTYDGHGGRENWGLPRFTAANVNALANGGLTPVILSWACQTGWFDNETDAADLDPAPGAQGTNNADESFAERFLRHNNGGAVAVIGSSRNSWDNNDFMMLGAAKAIWPEFDPDPPLSPGQLPDIQTSALVRMGQINTFSKVYMANRYTHDDHREASFEMYTLFGDPEMPVWTEEPLTFKVSHPEGIGASGEQDFVVKVTDDASDDTINNAVVTLTRDNQLLSVRYTNPGGIARFTHSSVGGGDLEITVTSLNYLPYQGIIKVYIGGAHLNRLDPENGIENQAVLVGGQNFSGNEKVDIYFGSQLLDSAQASSGDFGQAGVEDFEITVPSPYELGPVNILAHGQTSDRYAVDIFYVRTANPIDLYLYSQWDSSTWNLTNGGDPVWNNPDIQFYDSAGNSVASNNLVSGIQYTVKAKIRNDTDFDAAKVRVTFKWANFGVGQPDRVWEEADTSPAILDVPANSVEEAEILWAPPGTGHLCMLVQIYHVEDINEDNNRGQENLHVGPTASPAKVTFIVYNPSKESAAIFLELRQVLDPAQNNKVWAAWVEHPDPQIIPAGESREATVIVDPKLSGVDSGETAEFVLTAFINGEMIGGVNFIITVK